MKRNSTNDMTAGPVLSQLAVFSVPILLGELFQQFYNSVDSAIVGNFVSPQALAAVGATSSITKMLVGFFVGISLGCTVVIARSFGAKEYDMLREEIHVIMNLSFVMGGFLSLLGVLITPVMLRLLGTPEDVLPLASLYLRIYFGGLFSSVLYNTATGILRAVGNSRLPLIFLILSSMTNIGLDLLFVCFFRLGVAGVAWATILSQLMAAVLCMHILRTTKECYRWELRGKLFSVPILREVFRIGLPTAVQKVITQFSNAIVISFVAHFGSSCMAGWAVYSKVNGFLGTTSSSIAASTTTFVSQNMGARKHGRIRKGILSSVLLSCAVITGLNLLILSCSDAVIRLFGTDPEMTAYAKLFIHTFLWFYLLQTIHQVMAGGLRGLGYASQSTIAILTALVGFRQVFLWVATGIRNTPLVVGFAYPAAWTLSILLQGCCYLHYIHRFRKNR